MLIFDMICLGDTSERKAEEGCEEKGDWQSDEAVFNRDRTCPVEI